MSHLRTAGSTVVQSHEAARDYLGLSARDAIAALHDSIQEQILTNYNKVCDGDDDPRFAESVADLPDDYVDDINLKFQTGMYDAELISVYLTHANGDYVFHTERSPDGPDYTIIELATGSPATTPEAVAD
jgi:hypothetical protein